MTRVSADHSRQKFPVSVSTADFQLGLVAGRQQPDLAVQHFQEADHDQVIPSVRRRSINWSRSTLDLSRYRLRIIDPAIQRQISSGKRTE